ncbi:MAG: hypothetical protein ACFFCS_01665 [Candidatus Hodarchaeota archaeon]
MVEEKQVKVPFIHSILYTEFTENGQETKAMFSIENLSSRTLTQIGINSYSLMISENSTVENGDKDAKQIIEEKNEFGIIPYVDQESTGISYLFHYKNKKKEDIHCTLTILFYRDSKEFLFKNHQEVKKILKYGAFKILKLNLGAIEPTPNDLNRQIIRIMEKLIRLKKEGTLPEFIVQV